jgi:hypothetical protein
MWLGGGLRFSTCVPMTDYFLESLVDEWPTWKLALIIIILVRRLFKYTSLGKGVVTGSGCLVYSPNSMLTREASRFPWIIVVGCLLHES